MNYKKKKQNNLEKLVADIKILMSKSANRCSELRKTGMENFANEYLGEVKAYANCLQKIGEHLCIDVSFSPDVDSSTAVSVGKKLKETDDE